MRFLVHCRIGVAAGLVALAATLQGQELAQAKPQGQPQPPTPIYRVDLVPTGSVFALGEPTLEGDTYVFRILPEKAIQRLPKSKVKAVTRRGTDFDKEVVYQLDLAPSGTLLVRDEPVKKGTNYIIYTFKLGTLMSVPQTDVLKVNRLTGMEAWKAEMIELGVVVLAGEQTGPSGGATVRSSGSGPGSPPAPGQAPNAKPGNWQYEGVPGSSDAYAPGNATVEKPGDTPMAPTPPPD